MPSWQVGAACYPSQLAANQAIASGQTGAVTAHGNKTYIINATNVTATSITWTLTPAGGGQAIVEVVPSAPQPCNLMGWQDGLQLGWLVGGAWIAVYAVNFLRQTIKTSMGEVNDA